MILQILHHLNLAIHLSPVITVILAALALATMLLLLGALASQPSKGD
jgi:hypothetical protein